MASKILQTDDEIKHGRSHLTGYDSWPPRPDILKHLTDISNYILSLQAGASLLDVGCGDGSITRLIAESNPNIKVVGMDVERHDHWKFHKLKNLSFVTGSIFKLPYGKDEFDTVIIKDVLHHLPKPEVAVKNLENVARRQVIIIEANRYNPVSFIRMVKIAKHEHFTVKKLMSMTSNRRKSLHQTETHVWPRGFVRIGSVHDGILKNVPALKKLQNYNFLLIELKD